MLQEHTQQKATYKEGKTRCGLGKTFQSLASVEVKRVEGLERRGESIDVLGDFVSELLGLLRSCLCPIGDSLSLF